MYTRERLKEAYENVSFSADITWTNSPNAYHKGNLELYLTEHRVQQKELQENRPRTVRECIPKSRLAQYSNYVYNESREMSYASSASNTEMSPVTQAPSEPWEMPEVGDLFKWFLKNLPEDKFSRREEPYESPFLSVSGFEDKILKIQITEDRVKNIWNKQSQFYEGTQTSQVAVNLFTSPMKNIFLFSHNYDYSADWLRNISITRDFDQIQKLSKKFQEQSSFIAKFVSGNHETAASGAESVSTEILYSEVLQGVSPSRKLMSSSRPEQSRALDEASTSEAFTNYTVLNSQRTGPEETAKNDNIGQSNFPKPSQSATVQPQTSNKFVSPKPPTPNVHFQSDSGRYRCPSTSQIPVESSARGTRTSVVHPLTSSYLQQTYFYSPVQALQRWVPSHPSYCPSQIFASSCVSVNTVMSNTYDVNMVLAPPPLSAPKTESAAGSRSFECIEEDSNQFKEETEEIDDGHQVSTSISEELEIQALEQYSNSNENFYQELERQAAEQYTNSLD